MKQYLYTKGENTSLDESFVAAQTFGLIKLAADYIFWKKGLRWYVIPIEQVERAYRRVEEVKTKVCCGPANFDIEKLVLGLKNGEELELRIGDGALRQAQELYKSLKETHPELQFGKNPLD